MIQKEKYNNLLYKSGSVINNLQVFIDTLIETGIVSKSKLKVTQNYLRQQLLTPNALEILKEYNEETDKIQSELKLQENENISYIIDEELKKL